ncbi:MAG: hypothetical protein JWO33_675 [Caulobacteraceae bacterium]|nr:hypothetical protein [Caulobacteraceae bacterium]
MRKGAIAAFALALAPPMLASPASAQVSASAALVSDYRFRGVSLSNERPSLSLNLAYDHPGGLYGGGSAIVQDSRQGGVRMSGAIGYLGYARRTAGGLSWDVGVSHQDLAVYAAQRYDLRYTEAYVGVARGRLSARLSYSPDYFPGSGDALYASLDGALRPAEDWRLFGHLGLLAPLGGSDLPVRRRERVDLRLGVARQFDRCELSLAWTAAWPGPRQISQQRSAIVVGAAIFF